MPIYLEPLSRRRFVGNSILAAASLLFAPATFAKSRKTAPDSWALLSDIHIASDRAQSSGGGNMAANLQAVCDQILAMGQGPQAMVVTGDLAFQSGQEGDYSTLSGLLKPLRQTGMPIHLVLGNHDNRERVLAAFYNKPKALVKDKQVSIVRTRYANWFMLDSLVQTLHTPGLLGTEQLQWLAKELDANSRKPAILAFHHQPNFDTRQNGLEDTAQLIEVIQGRRQVKACVFGHTHSYGHVQHQSGIHLINLPSTAYSFDPNSPCAWVMATHKKNGLRLELRCLDSSQRRHGEVIDLQFRPLS